MRGKLAEAGRSAEEQEGLGEGRPGLERARPTWWEEGKGRPTDQMGRPTVQQGQELEGMDREVEEVEGGAGRGENKKMPFII